MGKDAFPLGGAGRGKPLLAHATRNVARSAG